MPVLRPKERQTAPESVITTFRLRKTLLAELDTAAERAGVSRNEAVAQLLRYALDADKKRKP